MIKGSNALSRSRVPEPGSFVRTRRQDPSAIRTKRRGVDFILMAKGGDQFSRGRIPKPGSFVRTRRQDPSTVRTEDRVVDHIPIGKGGDEGRQHVFTMSN